ncbi:hypothetical protein [Enterovirga rhinocerotis]|uniref:Carbohydrate binding protein n=1 Tax=Enterovirga rhinocerotis TaxID=1339210 RepID=A0A4V3DXW3_9HYPH|nr:hypothetical protein [Enterovirga rhinocerotis]TDR90279.1 hypothetical protein EV668_3125 [Enterovirga rhinocerotis]
MGYYAPAGATLTLAANSTAGTIQGDMSAFPVTPGMAIGPGSRAGIDGPTRIITTWTPNGTTGASFTIDSAFSNNTAFAAGTPFVIDNLAVPGSVIAQTNLGMITLINALKNTFGLSLTLDQASKSFPLDRADGNGSFTEWLFRRGTRKWFGWEHRTISGTERLLGRTYLDGVVPTESIDIDGSDGTVDFRVGEGTLASAATTNLGSVRKRRINITGAATITSFGSSPNCEKILRFSGAATVNHNASTLVIPGGANITVASGDILHVASNDTGGWRVLNWTRGSGQVPFGGAATETADGLLTGANLKRLNGLANGPNLVPNGGFEQGLSGWPTFSGFSDGAAQQVVTSINALSGGSYLRLNFGAKTTGTLNAVGERFPVVPGGRYAISAWVRANAALANAGLISLRAQWFKSDGTASTTAFSTIGVGSTTAWALLEGQVTAPADAGYCEFRMVVNVTLGVSSSVTWVDFDECTMTPVASIAAASLPSFTVATLPAANMQVGHTAWASNCRAFNGAGTQEGAGAGTGAVVTWNGSVWKIAGTNVTAIA